ncbi:zinc finger protein ZPR1-like isoform X2 [Dysidea avara]|uniref:zinc finger protein ZPR1-like isoform X2 n=1 Tax=Dysidea avara TaxID=196820 RepID=UPI003328C29C
MASGATEGLLIQGSSNEKPLFMDVNADEEAETTEIESLCMQCGENGTTRLMLTKIPMFREVILMSFSCPHCNASNCEIQPGAPLQDKGVRYTFKVCHPQDINRQMVKSDTASFSIPELEFEVPVNTQKGVISTVEGILDRTITGLDQDQTVRRISDPDMATKIDGFISTLRNCMEVKSPFTVVLDDPAGNSFVDNPHAPKNDPQLKTEHYTRTPEQDLQLGISQMALQSDQQVDKNGVSSSDPNDDIGPDEVLSIPSNCPACNSPVETRMKLSKIPYFKEVVVMALNCEMCGHRTNEVKTGGGVSEKGVKFTLHITSIADLNRDVLKSESAMVMVPELELELESGGLSGKFTTVEGLLDSIRIQLLNANPFGAGDSTQQQNFSDFIGKLTEIVSGNRLNVHLILDDPAGNSFIQNPHAPQTDPNMTVESYTRTFEQNDLLGDNY